MVGALHILQKGGVMDKNPKEDGFLNIDEELTWCFFKQNGNPYVASQMIKERYHSSENNIVLGKIDYD